MSNNKKVTSTDTQETPVESEVVQEIVQETAVEQTEVTQKAPSKVVYVGPTIFGVAVQNTVFNNGLSDELKKPSRKNHPLLTYWYQLQSWPKQ